MFDRTDQKAVAEAVFEVTGQKLPEDDPLVVAALFYASTMRLASEGAASAIAVTGERIASSVNTNVDEAKLLIHGAVQEAVSILTKAADEAQIRASSTVDEARAATREAVDEAWEAARDAAKAAETASTVAVAVARQAGVNQAAFVDLLDRHLSRIVSKSAGSQSSQVIHAVVPRWQLGVAGLVGALVCAAANFAACGFSLTWVQDARTGREFLGAIPRLDPALKQELIANLEKLQQRE
jgi:hypothetical protein